MLMQEQGTKMYTDAILKTHQRVVQVPPAHLFLTSHKVSFGVYKKCTFVNIFTSLSSWAAQMPLCVQCSWKFCSRANQKEFSCLWTRWVFVIEATLLLNTKIKHCFLALKFLSLFIFSAHKKVPILLKNNKAVALSVCVPQHTQADFQVRFKGRPELEGLLAQMNQ